MRTRLFQSLLVFTSLGTVAGWAQAPPPPPDFAGPGVLSEEVGEVGSRSGRTADLRLYAGANGLYETGLTPLITDAQGNLLKVEPLWGVEGRFGAYGVHRWKKAQLGLDYMGGYRHYTENSYYDASDHSLSLALSYQHSRRLMFKFDENAGTYGRTIGTRTTQEAASMGLGPTGQILDSRNSYLRSSAEAIILQSARVYYTVGATGYLSNWRAQELADTRGYNLTGTVNRRMTQYQSVGAYYNFGQQDIPFYAAHVNLNTFEGTYDAQFGPLWNFSVRGGFYISESTSVSSVQLDPILAGIFGTRTLLLQTYRRNLFPSGAVTLGRQFKTARLSANYFRSVGTGNGLTSVSQVENITAGYSYSGIKKWNFGIDGGYYSVKDLLKATGWSGTFSGGVGITYALGRDLHLNARFDARHVDLDTTGVYRRDSSRTTFGVFWSPGEFPLSLW